MGIDPYPTAYQIYISPLATFHFLEENNFKKMMESYFKNKSEN